MRHSNAESRRNEAFELYVMPELDVLTRVALSITRNPTDAEDLVQDTLLRAYRSADRFDGRHPRAWLLTIMRNAQLNRVRRRRPDLLRDPDHTFDEFADPDPDDVEATVVDPVFDSAVAAAFNSLPDRYRAVLELVDLGGLSYRDASGVLEIPVGTVMSRLHRARKRIRRDLEADGTWSRGGDVR